MKFIQPNKFSLSCQSDTFKILQLFIFLFFVSINIGLVFSKGICCGDDSYHALVAKNLSIGLGYASTIQESSSNYIIREYDTRLGVGPSIIIPASIIIKLFGNTYWAPGLSILIICSILFFLIWKNFPTNDKENFRFTFGIIVFFTISFNIFGFHSEQWYALLGEIPAALMIFLAILFFNKYTEIEAIYSGILFSLAILAKTLAILPVCVFSLIIFFELINNKKTIFFQNKIKKSQLVKLIIGFVSPFLLFDVWKLFRLGFYGFLQNWFLLIMNFFEKAVKSDHSLWQKLVLNYGTINERFGISILIMVMMIILAGYLLKKDKIFFPIFNQIIIILFFYVIYWFFLSNGWARYLIIAILLMIFTIIFPIISSEISGRNRIVYFAFVLFFELIITSNIPVNYPFRGSLLFQPNENIKTLLQVKDELDNPKYGKPFITQWWATCADIEYILDEPLNFTSYKDNNFVFSEPFLVVLNSKFLIKDDNEFLTLLDSCNINYIGEYIIGYCE